MSTPRENFQKSLKPDSRYRNVMLSDEIQSAMTHAMAQYAMESPNTDNLAGAKRILDILATLADPPPPPRKWPKRSLKPPEQPEAPKEKEKPKDNQ